ncbi:hypothetical protein C8F04DRAFT_1281230 [Mycena alexandri]|uniref:Uncharacterized protein n=1 Tax=Mycena alexandri TaxID=1745969 RepID=A0AAD6WL78_9AGAR|nr:hypothetical protein C8F04DRAFT_1281230 [Mycena alexandri]
MTRIPLFSSFCSYSTHLSFLLFKQHSHAGHVARSRQLTRPPVPSARLGGTCPLLVAPHRPPLATPAARTSAPSKFAPTFFARDSVPAPRFDVRPPPRPPPASCCRRAVPSAPMLPPPPSLRPHANLTLAPRYPASGCPSRSASALSDVAAHVSSRPTESVVSASPSRP